MLFYYFILIYRIKCQVNDTIMIAIKNDPNYLKEKINGHKLEPLVKRICTEVL